MNSEVKRYTAAEVRFSTQGGTFVLASDFDAVVAREAVLEDIIDKLSLAFDSRVKTIGQLLSELTTAEKRNSDMADAPESLVMIRCQDCQKSSYSAQWVGNQGKCPRCEATRHD